MKSADKLLSVKRKREEPSRRPAPIAKALPSRELSVAPTRATNGRRSTRAQPMSVFHRSHPNAARARMVEAVVTTVRRRCEQRHVDGAPRGG
eukprot:scaffold36275_cov154-Isochrysis_galbana.AAC.44